MTRLGYGRLVPDRGHHVLQRPPFGNMVMHLVGGEQRQAVRLRQRVEPLDPCDIVARVKQAAGKMAQRFQLRREMWEYLGEHPLESHPVPARSGASQRDDIAFHRYREALLQIERREEDEL